MEMEYDAKSAICLFLFFSESTVGPINAYWINAYQKAILSKIL